MSSSCDQFSEAAVNILKKYNLKGDRSYGRDVLGDRLLLECYIKRTKNKEKQIKGDANQKNVGKSAGSCIAAARLCHDIALSNGHPLSNYYRYITAQISKTYPDKSTIITRPEQFPMDPKDCYVIFWNFVDFLRYDDTEAAALNWMKQNYPKCLNK